MQADTEVAQIWDRTIGDTGRSINTKFAAYSSGCGGRKELLKRGATLQAVDGWEGACIQSLAQRARFETVFKRIMQQRGELNSFQGFGGINSASAG